MGYQQGAFRGLSSASGCGGSHLGQAAEGRQRQPLLRAGLLNLDLTLDASRHPAGQKDGLLVLGHAVGGTRVGH